MDAPASGCETIKIVMISQEPSGLCPTDSSVVAMAQAMTTRAVARQRAGEGASSSRRNAANLSNTGREASLI